VEEVLVPSLSAGASEGGLQSVVQGAALCVLQLQPPFSKVEAKLPSSSVALP
jgi:uncharacterized Ntn-hydrolase superfamily protein